MSAATWTVAAALYWSMLDADLTIKSGGGTSASNGQSSTANIERNEYEDDDAHITYALYEDDHDDPTAALLGSHRH